MRLQIAAIPAWKSGYRLDDAGARRDQLEVKAQGRHSRPASRCRRRVSHDESGVLQAAEFRSSRAGLRQTDRKGTQRVVIINQTLADKMSRRGRHRPADRLDRRGAQVCPFIWRLAHVVGVVRNTKTRADARALP